MKKPWKQKAIEIIGWAVVVLTAISELISKIP